MSVKTEKVEQEQNKVVDDISEHVVVSEPVISDEVEVDKIAALKAMMAEKQGDEKETEMPPKIVVEKRRTLKLGVIGSGQAGSRLAESLFKLGYKALAFNTALQDLEHIQIPEGNKYLLEYGLGGASKDQRIGHQAAQTYKDMIHSAVKDKLDDSHAYVFCTSLGGGSGSGSIDTMVDVLSAMGKPVVVITVLPMTNEDAATKKNALDALAKLTVEVQNKRVHNLIVVDNAKIETIFGDVGPMEFYKVSNAAIVDPLDVFNTYSSAPSNVKSLDPMEFTKILIDGGGLSLYGSMTVANYEEDTALAEAVITNLNSGLLAEGFDLKQTRYVGAMFLANKRVWNKLPSSSINYAMAMVQDHAGTPEGVFRGIYEADIEEDVVKVYSFFSGLALPDSRVQELKVEVEAHSETLKNKTESRNLNLTVDTAGKVVSKAEEVVEMVNQKNTMFNKFTKGLVDRRKK
jgi:cell division GTPase FtsZ